jgi:hypothetical protein
MRLDGDYPDVEAKVHEWDGHTLLDPDESQLHDCQCELCSSGRALSAMLSHGEMAGVIIGSVFGLMCVCAACQRLRSSALPQQSERAPPLPPHEPLPRAVPQRLVVESDGSDSEMSREDEYVRTARALLSAAQGSESTTSSASESDGVRTPQQPHQLLFSGRGDSRSDQEGAGAPQQPPHLVFPGSAHAVDSEGVDPSDADMFHAIDPEFDTRGRHLYGSDAWDRGVNGGIPLRLVFAMKESEMASVQRAARLMLAESSQGVSLAQSDSSEVDEGESDGSLDAGLVPVSSYVQDSSRSRRPPPVRGFGRLPPPPPQ